MALNQLAVPMKDINQYLVCSLCGGYYIDATTIMECLHSFCKTCIVRYLETSNYCPKCDVQVHKTRPLLNIRPDITLQDLVYKLVPGLLTCEMKKRREFYSVRPPAGETEDRQTAHERKLMAEEDKISIALEFSPDGKPPLLFRHRSRKNREDKKPEKVLDCRYLLCPSDFTIAHIKKFIRMKFGLASDLAIDVFHDFEPLGDRYTLLDLAYMFLWRKRSPFKLFYSVYVTGERARRRKLEQSDKAEEPAEKRQAATPTAPPVAPKAPSTPIPPAPTTPAAAKPITPAQPTQPATPVSTSPDVKQAPPNKTPAAPVSTPTAVPMSTAPRTVINKSPLQMKIVAPTERATSVKTQTTQQPPATARTPPSNGKPTFSRQTSHEGHMRPGQAMILPVRLPLSAVMGPSPGSSSPIATNNNKPLLPRSPITAQHQLPKQVTRDSELKAAHKAHAHKPLVAKAPSAIVSSSVQQKSPIGLNGQKFQTDFKVGHKSPSNGQKSPTTPKPEVSPRNHVDTKTPPRQAQVSPIKEKDSRPNSASPGASGTLKTVLPVPHATPSNSKGGPEKQQQRAEPKVPPLRIPISRTDLSRTDLSIHHAPIRRPILQHILPKKPKKKDTNKSKVDLLQARFGRNTTNGQTLFMNKVHQTTNKVHQTTHRAPSVSASSSSSSSSAAASGASMVPRGHHLLIPKPAHMNEKPTTPTMAPPLPNFQNTNHAHNSSPPSHNASAAASASAGSHSPAEEQDVPLDLQTPKTVKVS